MPLIYMHIMYIPLRRFSGEMSKHKEVFKKQRNSGIVSETKNWEAGHRTKAKIKAYCKRMWNTEGGQKDLLIELERMCSSLGWSRKVIEMYKWVKRECVKTERVLWEADERIRTCTEFARRKIRAAMRWIFDCDDLIVLSFSAADGAGRLRLPCKSNLYVLFLFSLYFH